MNLPVWQIALCVLVGILLAGPPISRWNDPPKRKWTREDEMDWRENQ